jgi:hypothetical protein
MKNERLKEAILLAASRARGSPSPLPISLPINGSNPISLSPSILFHLSPCPIKNPKTSYTYPRKTLKYHSWHIFLDTRGRLSSFETRRTSKTAGCRELLGV